MTKNDKGNEKVAKKLEEMGLMPSDDDVKAEESVAEKDQANKMPYALILTFIMFVSGILGIILMSVESQIDEVSTVPESQISAPTVEENAFIKNQNQINNVLAERRKVLQEKRQSIPMSANHPGLRNNVEQPAWVKQQRDRMQKQMARRSAQENMALANMAQANMAQTEAPAWVKERQAMMEKQRTQQMQQQKQMMANHQQWLKSQQWNQPVNMNVQPLIRQPVYYYPNGYYPPASYYGPRR